MYAFGCGALQTVAPSESKRSKRDKDNAPTQSVMMAEEILVTKSDLEEKAALMAELKAKVEELTLRNNYQLRLKDLNYKEKIKQVEEKFQQELAADKARHQSLVEEKADMEMDYDDKIATLEGKHVQELEELEATYKAKITAEIERYEALVKDREQMNEAWDETNAQMVEAHEKHVAELKAEYTRKLEEEEALRAKLEQEKWGLEADIDKQTNHMEEDADLEIEELKQKYDARLSQERKSTLMLKGENGIMKKKFHALMNDISTHKGEINGLVEKEKELYEQIRGLEKDIQGHKKEIREREETITDKEKRIYDLRKKNQELEKFKFVLNYKIQELKRQIMPRKKEIADMREQIKEMELELLQYHKSNAALDLMIGELKLKKEGMQREIDELEAQIATGESIIRRFCSDLHDAVQHIGDYKVLKQRVTSLYRQYVHEGVASAGSGEADMQREYSRQREYLEKSVESLKRKLAKDSEMHRNDKARLMRENTQLTKEINMLRRELKFANDTRTATTMGLTITADGVLEAATHGRAPSRGSKATGTRRNSAGSQQAFGASYGSGAGGGVPRGNSAGPAAEDGFSPEDAREIEMQHQQIQQVRGCWLVMCRVLPPCPCHARSSHCLRATVARALVTSKNGGRPGPHDQPVTAPQRQQQGAIAPSRCGQHGRWSSRRQHESCRAVISWRRQGGPTGDCLRVGAVVVVLEKECTGMAQSNQHNHIRCANPRAPTRTTGFVLHYSLPPMPKCAAAARAKASWRCSALTSRCGVPSTPAPPTSINWSWNGDGAGPLTLSLCHTTSPKVSGAAPMRQLTRRKPTKPAPVGVQLLNSLQVAKPQQLPNASSPR